MVICNCISFTRLFLIYSLAAMCSNVSAWMAGVRRIVYLDGLRGLYWSMTRQNYEIGAYVAPPVLNCLGTAIGRYGKLARRFTLGLTLANFASSHYTNQYSNVAYPIWSEDKQHVFDGSPIRIASECAKYIVHDLVVLTCCVVKSVPYGVVFPLTIAEFVYEFEREEHWRKFFNIFYTDSKGARAITRSIEGRPGNRRYSME